MSAIAADTRPAGWIAPGEILFSKSGRQLSPVPHFNAGGAGQRRIDKKLQDWLVAEAQREGIETGANRWAADALAEMNPRNLSPMDVEMLRETLFGKAWGPDASNRVTRHLISAWTLATRARAGDGAAQAAISRDPLAVYWSGDLRLAFRTTHSANAWVGGA